MNEFFIIILFIVLNSIFFFSYKRISSLIKLYDYPDNIRKKHLKPVPLLGGIQLILNIYIIYFTNNYLGYIDEEIHLGTLVFFSTLVFILGILDDKFDIKVRLKFIFLLLIILFLIIYNDNLQIKNLYFETFNTNFEIGKISIFFTVLCFLLFLNACNMFDGVNLQLSVYSIQVFIFFLIQNFFLSFSLIIIVFSLFFILLNKDGRIFFGDSGSLLISFLIAYLVITQYNINFEKLSCEMIFLIMFLPGIDMFRLFLLRIISNKNPFKPDRNHIHHLLNKKFSFLKSTIVTQLTIFCALFLSIYIETIYIIILLLLLYVTSTIYLHKLIDK
jgi:UDP-GlcNAc:undecaprenyl-phosphate GlcNAc-1-phosphate transferase